MFAPHYIIVSIIAWFYSVLYYNKRIQPYTADVSVIHNNMDDKRDSSCSLNIMLFTKTLCTVLNDACYKICIFVPLNILTKKTRRVSLFFHYISCLWKTNLTNFVEGENDRDSRLTINIAFIQQWSLCLEKTTMLRGAFCNIYIYAIAIFAIANYGTRRVSFLTLRSCSL